VRAWIEAFLIRASLVGLCVISTTRPITVAFEGMTPAEVPRDTDGCGERGKAKSGAGVPGGRGVGCSSMTRAYPRTRDGTP
jgi:hypothetical protein